METEPDPPPSDPTEGEPTERGRSTREPKYSLAQLARLTGVRPRTVRYYVQEGIIPPPLGRGRGPHYDDVHRLRLLGARALQARGYDLATIRGFVASHWAHDALQAGLVPPLREREDLLPTRPPRTELPQTEWTRVELAPGLELSVARDRRLPTSEQLTDLAELCGRMFAASSGESSSAGAPR